DQASGYRGELLELIWLRPVGHRHQDTIRGHHGGPQNAGNTLGEISDEPVRVLRIRGRIACFPLSHPVPAASRSGSSGPPSPPGGGGAGGLPACPAWSPPIRPP